jgi:hypothetical protein
MNEDYSKYLVLMVLIVIGAVAAAVVLMARVRHPNPRTVKIKPVGFGSVSLFFDKSGNVTIIPYVADLFGEGKATTDVTLLPQPYKPGRLGAAIRDSLASCKNGKPAGSAKLMTILQFQSWKAFTEGKSNLSIYYREGSGIIFNTTVRTSEGAYIFNTRGIENCLPADAGDEAIGSTSLELLRKCRS